MTVTKTAFKDHYANLPMEEKISLRNRIVQECGISIQSFYLYLTKQPGKLVRERIESIINLPGIKLWDNPNKQ